METGRALYSSVCMGGYGDKADEVSKEADNMMTDWETSKGRTSNFRFLRFEMGINITHRRNLLILTQ